MENLDKNFLFLMISKGAESTDAVEIKRYIGVGTCEVVGINPTKAEIKELMGYEPSEEPQYYGVQEIDGKKVPYARISFVVKTIPEKCNGIETTQMLTIFLRNQYRQGTNSGKYQIIDNFGRTAWATREEIEAKKVPQYSNGAANIAADYNPCFVSQDILVDFLIKYLNIPAPANYVNGSWVEKSAEDQKDCMCALTEIPNYFKGNFSELKEAIALQPNNKIKVLFGIRTGEDGRIFQDIYPNLVLRSSASNYDKFQKEIEERKNAGALVNRTYEFTDIHEYNPQPTNFEEQPSSPFGEEPAATPW